MSKENSKSSILKLAAILFAITFISTLALTVCNHLTKDTIADINTQKANEAKQAVLKSGETFTEIETNKLPEDVCELVNEYNVKGIFEASDKNGEFAGYCVNIGPTGFGGEIDMFVGIDKDLKSFTGIKIISMAETPGLGAKAQEASFANQYASGKKGTLEVVKNASAPTESQINAISGATITSEAVTKGANNALEVIQKLNEKEAE